MNNRKSVFNWQLFIGFVFVVTGGLFLADQFLEVELMRNYWPLLIVLFGLMFFLSMVLVRRHGAWLAIPGAVITTAGIILFIHNTFDLWVTWTYAWALLISAVGLGMLIMNIYLKRDGLRKASGWVIGVGLTLFVIFGILFEMILNMAGSSVNSGVFLGSGLVLLGLFIVFSKWIFSDKTRKAVKESAAEPPQAVSQEEPQPSTEDEPEEGVTPREDLEFSKLIFDGAGDVFIEQGSTCDWTVEGDPELVEMIKGEVIDDTLLLKLQSDQEGLRKVRSILEESQLRFHVRVKSLSGLTLSGAGSIHADLLTGENLDILHAGEGQLILNGLGYQTLQVALQGLGEVALSGDVQNQDVDLTGFGTYKAENLKTQKANVTLTGAGKARIWVEGELNASLDGAGSILYKGEPAVEKTVTGLGSVKPLET